MTAEMDQIERLERLLRWCTWLLRISSVVALALVSWGSYSVVRWIGMPIPVAVAYPLVIDMAMLYVTPFAVNAMLPNEGDWPIRRRAGRIRAFVWLVVAAFNELHAVMMVWHAAGIPVDGPMRGVAYGVASVIGVGPVVFYGYAYAIEAQVAAWVLARKSEIRTGAEAKQTEATEEEAEAAKVAARTQLARAQAEAAKAQAEAARAARPPREAPRPDTPAAPAASAGQPSGKRTAEQEAFLAGLPGATVGAKTEAFLVQRHRDGDPIGGTEAAHFLGTDPATTRRIYNRLRDDGKLNPRLALAGG